MLALALALPDSLSQLSSLFPYAWILTFAFLLVALTMELGDLSEDVLALIFEFECGADSVSPLHAWMAGSRKLMAKMANRGITVVKLRHHDQTVPVRVPDCVAHWKLARFTIYADSSSQFTPNTLPLERTLASSQETLKTLDLAFGNATYLMFPLASKLSPPPASAKPSSSSSAVSIGLQPQTTGIDAIIPQGSLFQRLETLTLNCRPSVDMKLLFAQLPRSLTSLTLECYDGFPILTPSFADLPPHLKRLLLPPRALVSEDALRTLPTGNELEVFDFPLLPKTTLLMMKEWKTLLPRLIDFPHTDIKTWYSALGFDKDDTVPPPQYPHNMRSLDLTNRHVNPRIPLPSGLYTLSWGDLTLGRDLLTKRIPSSLTVLALGHINWSEIDPKDWPPKLYRLLCLDLEFSFANAHRLPRSLRHIHPSIFGDTEERANFDFSAAFAIGRRMLLENEVDRRLWSNAKQELLETSSRSDSAEKLRIERYISKVEEGGLFGLPIGMTALSMSVFPHVVPPYLTSLRTFLDREYLEKRLGENAKSFFELLPPSLLLQGEPFIELRDEIMATSKPALQGS